MKKCLTALNVIGIAVFLLISLYFREGNAYTHAAWACLMVILAMGAAYSLKTGAHKDSHARYVGLVIFFSVMSILGLQLF